MSQMSAGKSHVRMSHAARMNESCQTYERVMLTHVTAARNVCFAREMRCKRAICVYDFFCNQFFFTGEIFTEEIVSLESSEVCAGRESAWVCEGGGGVVMVYLQKRPMDL